MEECGITDPYVSYFLLIVSNPAQSNSGLYEKKKKKWPTSEKGLDSHGPNSVALVPMNLLWHSGRVLD